VELAELNALVREVHTVVCATKPEANGASASVSEPAAPARPTRKRSQPITRNDANKTEPQEG